MPPPRKHRHRYRGVFAPNHRLRKAGTALAIGNVGRRRDAATDGHAVGGHTARGDATADCCDSCDKPPPPPHDTTPIACAKLRARVREEFPFACPGCGGDIRLIAFINDPGPIRKILAHLGEPLEPPSVSPARGPPTDWGELVQAHDDRALFRATDRRAARDRYPQPLTGAGRKPPKPRERRNGELGRSPRRREKNANAGGCALFWRTASGRPKRPISLLKSGHARG